ncbi:myotubularin-related protein 10-A isoform X1 [Maniola jurtina]|uniref:myotubularin-related protein 10-A isoform X1 n=1 Tax=Maniola jurtina TaxID=191418 RepID=UPI001E68995F|nr:myotubularin-related protein 10-A isoform X1 [Maniola jurtina]
MNEKKVVQNFKSYINVPPMNNGDKNGSLQELKPKLLNGEQVVGQAHSVVMLAPLSERDRGRFGSLFVTNYKLTFVPLDSSINDEYGQRNNLVGTFDVPLTGVGALWQTDGGLTRRRRLVPRSDVPAKLKGLQVVCKNMKVLSFNFTNSPIGNGRQVAMALLHHAFPKRHDLLFAFEYREPYYPTLPSDLNMFQRPGDWKRELERCECPHWRITCINGTSDAFMLTAGETLIVPSSVLDCNLIESARHFRSGRVPVWVWGRADGAALLRSGELLQTEQSATAESVLLEQVRRSHPKLKPPHVLYLCGNSFTSNTNANTLPPLSTLNTAYKKLADLCTPTTLSSFWIQDSQYYSILESSRWLRYVANCIAFADDAASHLANNQTVVLQEGDGVDYSAVVSCLTQLLLDDHFRTIAGFQSLVQKEWVALGHPFCDRFGLPRPGNTKEETEREPTVQIAPVFLLFLDCTWQLQRQFPAAFQFTETYLTTLWDCTHNHLFDTFLFNCPRDRELAVSKNFVQRPLWDWGEQFSEQDIALFYNPLFAHRTQATPVQRLYSPDVPHLLAAQVSISSGRRIGDSRLEPCTSVAGVELWSQCYERWLPPLDAPRAGPVQYYLHHCAIKEQIQKLNDKLSTMSILNRHSNGDTDLTELPPTPEVTRFYPFSLRNNDTVTRSLDSMQVSLIDASQLLDSQSLLNAPD